MTKFFIGVFFAGAVFINIATINDGHNWGDDFAQYILCAQNILNHKTYGSGIMLENPYSYPPGFPFLIAPIIKFFGVNFVILKLINILFWYLSVLVLYPLFVQRLGRERAVLSCLFLAYSANLFFYKQNVLSDIPFFFFFSSAITVFTLSCDKKLSDTALVKSGTFLVFLVVLMAGTLIRSAGYVVCLSTVIYLVFIKKYWKAALLTIMTAGVTAIVQSRYVLKGPGFLSYAFGHIREFVSTIIPVLSTPLKSLVLLLCPDSTVLTGSIYNFIEPMITFLAPVIYFVMTCVVIQKFRKRTLSYLGCFTFLYLIIFLFWTGFDPNPRTLVRLAYPLFVPALLMMAIAAKKVSPAWKKPPLAKQPIAFKTFLYLLIFLNTFNIASAYQFNDDVVLKPQNQELFHWVRDNLKEEDRYIFQAPRALALFTHRVGAPPMVKYSPRNEDLIERAVRLDIAYVILVKPVDVELVHFFDTHEFIAVGVWENQYYKIYKMQNFTAPDPTHATAVFPRLALSAHPGDSINFEF